MYRALTHLIQVSKKSYSLYGSPKEGPLHLVIGRSELSDMMIVFIGFLPPSPHSCTRKSLLVKNLSITKSIYYLDLKRSGNNGYNLNARDLAKIV